MADMRLIVTGAAGRMGRMLIKAIAETPGVTLAAAIERKGAAAIGADASLLAGVGASGILISDDPCRRRSTPTASSISPPRRRASRWRRWPPRRASPMSSAPPA